MKVINISRGLTNFSQRNNEINPLISCNTTSMVMALSYIPELWEKFTKSKNYLNYSKKFKQEEDCLQQFILDNHKEPTVHSDLSEMTNKFIGEKVTYFSTKTPIKDIINDLKNGLPVVMSGTFPGHPNIRKAPLGHIVVLVGAEWDNDGYENFGYQPDRYIIDDPYGNTMNNWIGSGNDIKIPSIFFDRWMKPSNNFSVKWTHRFLII